MALSSIALAPRRRLVALGLLLMVACSTPGARSTSAPRRTLRVLTWNIHHGEGEDGVFDLERLARFIVQLEPDLVALQEVDQGTTRSSGVFQADELGRLTSLESHFGRDLPFGGGWYGDAVLTRLPALEATNHRLPNTNDGEPRGLLEILVDVGGETVSFVSTHWDHRADSVDREPSAARAVELARAHPERPMILAGDLNAKPGSQALEIALAEFTSAHSGPTFPSSGPQRQIDWILLRPAARWRVLEARVVEVGILSDHQAVLAVLELVDER